MAPAEDEAEPYDCDPAKAHGLFSQSTIFPSSYLRVFRVGHAGDLADKFCLQPWHNKLRGFKDCNPECLDEHRDGEGDCSKGKTSVSPSLWSDSLLPGSTTRL